jgi:hypothetical protein
MADISTNKEPDGYSASNPHPGHGIDPNIMNELGHTVYPKYVDHPSEKRVDHTTTHKNNHDTVSNVIETKFPARVLVQNKKEEDELMKQAKNEPDHKKNEPDYKKDERENNKKNEKNWGG